jgi:carbonic anhydrase
MYRKTSLGRVAIVTCMDPRVHLSKVLGLAAEEYFILRNAGGRVTPDVLRGLVLCTKLMEVTEVGIIHHTGCRLQQENEKLVAKAGVSMDFMTFTNLESSILEDVQQLSDCPALSRWVRIWGGLYSVKDHTLRLISGSRNQPFSRT